MMRLAACAMILMALASQPATAAGAHADADLLERFFACRQRDASAPRACAARAAYERGLALEKDAPDRAIPLYELAISKDSSFAPAYISLGRAMVEAGMGVRAAAETLLDLSARAPKTPELERMRAKLKEALP